MNKRKKIGPLEVVKYIANYEPLYIVLSIFQIIIKTILPFVYIYLPKMIIEELTGASNDYQRILLLVLTFGGILLVLGLANSSLKNKSDYLGEVFAKRLKYEIGKTAMTLEIKDIEDPKIQDTIRMANEAANITRTFNTMQNIISHILIIMGTIFIIFKLNIFIVVLIFINLFFKILFENFKQKDRQKLRLLQSANSRFVEYLFNISYASDGGAKEIRINHLQEWYINKNKKYRQEMVKLHYKSFKLRAFYNIVIELFLSIQAIIILILLSRDYVLGNATIAQFIMYFTTITTLTMSLTAITEQVSTYNHQVLGVLDYKELISLIMLQNKTNNKNNISIKKTVVKNNIEIEFHNVSFSYPNSKDVILNKINIKIKNNEKLVIVGLNGAGKTTFIKLLCKFYEPTSGMITLNGIDIWKIPNENYYKLISAVFQDFVNFAFSIKENIALNENPNTDKISEIIKRIKLNTTIENLPRGLDTYLSKRFDTNGIELSGGQRQKVAIARAIYKETPILILDEPTASLDPKAESEIYNDFLYLAKNKTTIFISHRLAASTLADNIAVFVKGEIIEYGSHLSLMEANGIYARMFTNQSSQYLDEKEIF